MGCVTGSDVQLTRWIASRVQSTRLLLRDHLGNYFPVRDDRYDGVVGAERDDPLVDRVEVVQDHDVLTGRLAYDLEFLDRQVHGCATAKLTALAHKRDALLRHPARRNLPMLGAFVYLSKELRVPRRANVSRHQNHTRLRCPAHGDPGPRPMSSPFAVSRQGLGPLVRARP